MRATGKTFRAVLNATLALSEGHNMIVVSLNYTEASRFIREVLDILATHGIVNHPLLSYTKYSIRFMDTELRTISVHDRNSPAFKGLRAKMIEDY